MDPWKATGEPFGCLPLEVAEIIPLSSSAVYRRRRAGQPTTCRPDEGLPSVLQVACQTNTK